MAPTTEDAGNVDRAWDRSVGLSALFAALAALLVLSHLDRLAVPPTFI